MRRTMLVSIRSSTRFEWRVYRRLVKDETVKNQRRRSPPPRTHKDFDWYRGSPSIDGYVGQTKSDKIMRNRFREGYYHFGVCFWGSVGKIVDIGDTTSGNYYLIHDRGNAREVFERIDWDIHMQDTYCIGAPQCTPEMLIEIYEYERKS